MESYSLVALAYSGVKQHGATAFAVTLPPRSSFATTCTMPLHVGHGRYVMVRTQERPKTYRTYRNPSQKNAERQAIEKILMRRSSGRPATVAARQRPLCSCFGLNLAPTPSTKSFVETILSGHSNEGEKRFALEVAMFS